MPDTDHHHGDNIDITLDLYDDGTLYVYNPDDIPDFDNLTGDDRRAALYRVRAAIDAELGDDPCSRHHDDDGTMETGGDQMREPLIKRTGFWGDLANMLCLRPVHRGKAPTCPHCGRPYNLLGK